MRPENRNNKNIIVITGPTGSGKTELAIAVAKHYDAPVISADSRQVYKGIPVGTAQPTTEQMAEVPHYLVACLDIREPFNAGLFEQQAIKLLGILFETHDTVVVAGGSGMYIDALCNGLDEVPGSDKDVRQRLTETAVREGLEPLAQHLRELDPEYYAAADLSNRNRLIRALEVCIVSGRPYSSFRRGIKTRREFGIVKIAIEMPRKELYERIDRRVDAMMEQGLEDETLAVYPHRELNSLQTVGYRELFEYFDGKVSREEAVELIKRNSRRYAKRQMTWFGKDPEITWFPPGCTDEVFCYIDRSINLNK